MAQYEAVNGEISVQFHPEVERAEIDETLARFGLQIKPGVGDDLNIYTIAVPRGHEYWWRAHLGFLPIVACARFHTERI
jgi:hypothetical protein